MSTRRMRPHTTQATVDAIRSIPSIRRVTARNLKIRAVKPRSSKARQDMLFVAVVSSGVVLLLAISFLL
jgi:hypothetical protein